MAGQVSITLRMVRKGSKGVNMKDNQGNTCENKGFSNLGVGTCGI